MAGVSKYLRIEQRLNRSLADQLRHWKQARLTAPSIARLLTLETGVPISPQSIRLWMRAIEDEGNGKAA